MQFSLLSQKAQTERYYIGYCITYHERPGIEWIMTGKWKRSPCLCRIVLWLKKDDKKNDNKQMTKKR